MWFFIRVHWRFDVDLFGSGYAGLVPYEKYLVQNVEKF